MTHIKRVITKRKILFFGSDTITRNTLKHLKIDKANLSIVCPP